MTKQDSVTSPSHHLRHPPSAVASPPVPAPRHFKFRAIQIFCRRASRCHGKSPSVVVSGAYCVRTHRSKFEKDLGLHIPASTMCTLSAPSLDFVPQPRPNGGASSPSLRCYCYFPSPLSSLGLRSKYPTVFLQRKQIGIGFVYQTLSLFNVQ